MNDLPVHAPLPLGLGSQVALTGQIGAVAAFIIAWAQNGLTPETVTLGAAAAGLIAAWFAGRSIQAKGAMTAAVGAYSANVVDDYQGEGDPTTPPEPAGQVPGAEGERGA